MTPTARPLTNTRAPGGVDVIERSPTNRTGVTGGAVASAVVRAAARRLGTGVEASGVAGRVDGLAGGSGATGGACASGSGSTTGAAGCCSARGGGGAATLIGTRAGATKISTPTSTTVAAPSPTRRSAAGRPRTANEGLENAGVGGRDGTTATAASRATAPRSIEGAPDLLSSAASIRRRASSICAKRPSTRAESSATAPLATRPSIRRTAPSVSVSRAAM